MLVILESPYAGNVVRNIHYARQCMKDCFNRGEFPFASHLLYTQVLNDDIISERMMGIDAGLEWGNKSEKTVVYTDYGLSKGMRYGIESAIINGRKIEYRRIL